MHNRRKYARFDCSKNARLGWKGELYSGTVTNLSITGAEVHLCMVIEAIPSAMTPGDTCELYLYDEKFSHPYKYDSKVIRIGASEVVVRIQGMQMHM